MGTRPVGAASSSLLTPVGALALVGAVLLAVGLYVGPLPAFLGWLALVTAFFAGVAEADAIPLPRPGRIAIRPMGCWEIPLAFTVRHRGRVYLFHREDAPDGGWAEDYTIRERTEDADPRWALPIAERDGWTLCGRAAVRLLEFEHHGRVTYVLRRSLRRALAAAAA